MNTLLERLAKLDACAVSDALDQLKLEGTVRGLSQLSTQRRIVGRAVTVELVPTGGTASARHLCTAAIEAAGPGDVIVIAHHGRTDVAGWGGILSLGASLRGVGGVIIDGACRDLDETRELGLPLYGLAAVPTTARGRIVEKDWNIPIDVGGVEVRPGDLVIADASGVVFTPQQRAADVLGAAERIAHRERLIMQALRDGQPISSAMGASYETMLEKGL